MVHLDPLRQLAVSVDLALSQQRAQRVDLEVQEALEVLLLQEQLEDLEVHPVDSVHLLVPELLAVLVRLLLLELVDLVRLLPLRVVLEHMPLEQLVGLAHLLHLQDLEAQHLLHRVDLELGDSEVRLGQLVDLGRPLLLQADSAPHQQLP